LYIRLASRQLFEGRNTRRIVHLPMEESVTPEATHSAAAFVGRAREMAELRGALDNAIAGQGRLFMLAGEPGIGKTRLADELARLAVAQGAGVAMVVKSMLRVPSLAGLCCHRGHETSQ
jgi:transcriptional regulator with AAA-type ATPase domain